MSEEEILIAIFLRNPGAILKSRISPEHFQAEVFRSVFQSMRAIAATGVEPDIFVIAENLARRELVSVLGKIQVDTLGALTNLPYYEARVIESANTRRVCSILKNTLQEIGDGSTFQQAMQSVMNEFASMTHEHHDQALDAKQILSKVVDYLTVMEEAKGTKQAGVKTGLYALDKILGGLHKSDLVVVGAQSGMGKTAFALSVLTNAARAGFNGGFVSTEMSAEQIGMRLVSIDSSIPVHRLRDADLEAQDYEMLTASAIRMQNLPFVVLDKPACKVSDISIQARAWAMAGGLDFLIIDYLTRLQPENNQTENRNLAVAAIATDLKTLARQLDIPVIALAQLNRGVMARKDKRPVMSDLRDSGVIEQEADQILFLYRDSVYNQEADQEDAEIIIDKNRHGPTGILNVRYVPDLTKWCDRDEY